MADDPVRNPTQAAHPIPLGTGHPFGTNVPSRKWRSELRTAPFTDQTGMVWVTDSTHLRMYHPRSNTVFTACSDQRFHQQPIKFGRAGGIALSEGKIFVVDSGKVMLLTAHED